MSESVTLTKGEFDRFWTEVLGDGGNWCIEEWDVDNDLYENAEPDDQLEIGALCLAWQARQGDPTPNEFMTSARIQSMTHLPVLRAWLDRQKLRHVSAWIPAAAVSAFERFVKGSGGQL